MMPPVVDAKCYERKEGREWAESMSEPIEMGVR